jgi:hypothetical protein
VRWTPLLIPSSASPVAETFPDSVRMEDDKAEALRLISSRF